MENGNIIHIDYEKDGTILAIFCNTLTSFTIEYEQYRLWTCYNCIEPNISIKKLFRNKIFYSCDIGEYTSKSPDITLLTSIDTDEEDETK